MQPAVSWGVPSTAWPTCPVAAPPARWKRLDWSWARCVWKNAAVKSSCIAKLGKTGKLKATGEEDCCLLGEIKLIWMQKVEKKVMEWKKMMFFGRYKPQPCSWGRGMTNSVALCVKGLTETPKASLELHLNKITCQTFPFFFVFRKKKMFFSFYIQLQEKGAERDSNCAGIWVRHDIS